MMQIYPNISEPVVRATEVSRLLSDHIGRSAAAAALVARNHDTAFVIDQALKIVDANAAAMASFRDDGFLSARGDIVHLNDEDADKWLKAAVKALFLARSVAQNKISVRYEGGLLQISVNLVPERDIRLAGYFLVPKFLVMVVVKNLRTATDLPDAAALPRTFGLSPAETRLCLVLAEGLSLAEAAERCGVTKETSRQRLKSIFQKTGTNRQSALVALLQRMA